MRWWFFAAWVVGLNIGLVLANANFTVLSWRGLIPRLHLAYPSQPVGS